MSAEEIRRFREVVKKNDADHLPLLDANRWVGGRVLTEATGTIYVYLHLTGKEGRRVWMDNPPIAGDTEYPPGDWLWRYSNLVSAFSTLESAKEPAK